MSTNTTSSLNRNTFFSIYRNGFLRALVRKKRFENRLINIGGLEYLNDNHRYLEILSCTDKIENNIFIRLDISCRKDFNQYIDNQYKYIVNYINLADNVTITRRELGELDSNLLGLTFGVNSRNRDDIGDGNRIELPSTLKILEIRSEYRHNSSFFDSRLITDLLINLPSKLRVLELPKLYNIQSTQSIVLPDTLDNFHYHSSQKNLEKFVVVPNKVFKDCKLLANNPKDFDWLHRNPWIIDVVIQNITLINRGLLPSNITKLSINCICEIELGSLPLELKWLSSHGCIPLVKDTLPPKLKILYIRHISNNLEIFSIPPSLDYLSIMGYTGTLEPRVLPNNLSKLELTSYDLLLEAGVLPLSLTDLVLSNYNHPLKSHVLPNSLTRLDMLNFNSTLEPHSLPPSLTNIIFYSFKKSFQQIGPLDRLETLTISHLNQSIETMISNIEKLSLTVYSIQDNVNLQQNNTMKELSLNVRDKYLDYKGLLLPQSLVKLKTIGILINQTLIPNGCIELITDNINVNKQFIPSSVKNVSFAFTH
ncbi:hypothetical protein CYY_000213 [Polysphondylium violaceum]|uniref:FNIP repeat-containing protein n=1 Tax=Polysphondylium violaceum TaxID=133409 RepID=A0A8J4V5V4_9MYCE|nr:hypothetical protein CYY_000213 [Polysphondylium violaceum]